MFRKSAWDAETVGRRSGVMLELLRCSGVLGGTDVTRQKQRQLIALHGHHEPLAIRATGLAGKERSRAR